MEDSETTGKAPAEQTNAQEPKSKMKLLRAIVILAIVLVGATILYNMLTAANGQGAGIVSSRYIGNAASNAEKHYLTEFDSVVYTLDDEPTSLANIANEKPLVINFWATWCPYCLQEMSDYQSIYNDYQDRVAFAFLDCADGARETPEDATRWLEENGYSLPAYFDTSMNATHRFGVTALPTTILVASNGEIISQTSGAIDPSDLRSALDTLV